MGYADEAAEALGRASDFVSVHHLQAAAEDLRTALQEVAAAGTGPTQHFAGRIQQGMDAVEQAIAVLTHLQLELRDASTRMRTGGQS